MQIVKCLDRVSSRLIIERDIKKPSDVIPLAQPNHLSVTGQSRSPFSPDHFVSPPRRCNEQSFELCQGVNGQSYQCTALTKRATHKVLYGTTATATTTTNNDNDNNPNKRTITQSMRHSRSTRLSVNEEDDQKAFIAFAVENLAKAVNAPTPTRGGSSNKTGSKSFIKCSQKQHHDKQQEHSHEKESGLEGVGNDSNDDDNKGNAAENLKTENSDPRVPHVELDGAEKARILRDVIPDVDIFNPSLFSETFSMAVGSALIFPLAEVREKARAGKIDAPEIVPLPVRAETIMNVFFDKKDELKKLLKPADFELMRVLYDLLNSFEDELVYNGKMLSSIISNATLHFFGDDDTKSECVYFLLLNPLLKRILLCFRGSITMKVRQYCFLFVCLFVI